MKRSFDAIPFLLVCFFTQPAQAGEPWRVIYLHPSGAKSSEALAASGTWQGGYKENSGSWAHPILWNGKADESLDLLRPPWLTGEVFGCDGVCQAGFLSSSTDYHAIIWKGSADDFVELPPGTGYYATSLYALRMGQQVGFAYHSHTGMPHAALWYGTPESFVDLHPSIARWSEAYATDGENQGGRAQIPSLGYRIDAALWHGTADSFVDMNPPGASESVILGMAPGVQVGWALVGGRNLAVLWHGTPASVVMMSPSGTYHSEIHGTTGTLHAGYVTHGTGCAEAGLWIGDDPESFINLQTYLDTGWHCSIANTVSVDKGKVYVAGSAGSPKGRTEAVLWIGRVPTTAQPQPAPKP